MTERLPRRATDSGPMRVEWAGTGRGSRGIRIEYESGRTVGCLRLDPGTPFGGDLGSNQRWRILAGEGFLSRDGYFVPQPVASVTASGNAELFRAGDRALLIARCVLTLRIEMLSRDAFLT